MCDTRRRVFAVHAPRRGQRRSVGVDYPWVVSIAKDDDIATRKPNSFSREESNSVHERPISTAEIANVPTMFRPRDGSMFGGYETGAQTELGERRTPRETDRWNAGLTLAALVDESCHGLGKTRGRAYPQ